jgi:hypothetical protein
MLDKQVGVYTVGEEIGRGSFAVVSKGHHMVTLPPPQEPPPNLPETCIRD